METSRRRGANLLLVAGYPPVARLGRGVRALLTNGVDARRMSILMQEIEQKGGSRLSFMEVRDIYIGFGSDRFRVAAMGMSAPQAILVTPLQSTPGSLALVRQEWNATTGDEPWNQTVSRHIAQGKGDLVVSGGMPLLAWDSDGVHPLSRSIAQTSDIRSYVDRIAPAEARARQQAGYFTFMFSERGQAVHAALFDNTEPLTLLLMLGSEQDDDGNSDLRASNRIARRRKTPVAMV